MRKSALLLIPVMVLLGLVFGCVTVDYGYREATYAEKIERGTVLRQLSLSPALAEKILLLDPEQITEKDIREILFYAPAPRIINIHGGIYPVYLAMKSFSKFLIGMGYPETKIRDPKNGSYSYSCYESSEKLAGLIAWYYEKEGMRPMIIGHSQGGMQAVKVLYVLAGSFGEKINVWNPITDEPEDRYSIVDPITGHEQPVVGVKVAYASAVGSGGLTRFLPNQWSMAGKLRRIPDSVDEFTGFSMGLDLFGGDLLGFGGANRYESNGKAAVRNVRLPTGYNHVTIPVTAHLVEDEEIRDWINNYIPTEEPTLSVAFQRPSNNILWAADVWHSIKKHWVMEVQKLIRTKRDMRNAN